jgi:hypothetical protein
MVPTDYLDFSNSYLFDREASGEGGLSSVCPKCERFSIVLGEDEQLFCKSCGYRESDVQK